VYFRWLFFSVTVAFNVNPHFDPVWVLIPMGYTQPMTRTYQNPYPCIQVQVLTGMGTGCPEKPQGSP